MEHVIIALTFYCVKMSMIGRNIVRSFTLHKIHLQFTFDYIHEARGKECYLSK